ncbi:S1 family peptidase [Nannocystaceae bacterium ST9]
MIGFSESRVVRILAVGGDPLGTGYALGNGRVLTARHVVAEQSQVLVDERTASIAWLGEHQDHDVAVLATETCVAAPDVGLFGGSPVGLEWYAMGHPGLTGGVAKAFEGRVKRAQDANRVQMAISVDATAPPQAAECKGMSGSAVFIADRLWGVLCSASTYFRGSELTAVSLTSLLDLDDFRTAIGLLPLEQQRRSVARGHVFAALRPEVAAYFMRAGLSGAVGGEALADVILDVAPPSALAKLCVAAIESCRDPVHADGIREVFEWSLPHAIGRRRARLGEDGCHRVRAGFLETVEPVIASDEERKMMVELGLLPVGHVPVREDKIPEPGMLDADKARVVLDDIMETWLGRFGLLDKYAKTHWEAKLNSMNAEMAEQSPFRFYSVVDEVDKIGGVELLKTLTEHLPNLRMMIADFKDPTPSETSEEAQLRARIDRFYRSYHQIRATKP